MAIGLYFDVHVDYAIAAQLRLRQVDVLTAQEDGADRLAGIVTGESLPFVGGLRICAWLVLALLAIGLGCALFTLAWLALALFRWCEQSFGDATNAPPVR
jgi:hypothetical protein